MSSNKISKYECLTGEKILPYNQKQIIEKTKFPYSPMGTAFEKQIKTIEDQGKKQVEALKDLKPKEQIKATEGKLNNKNNQSIAANIFNDLIKKSIMNELYESLDKNRYFE